MSTTALVTEYRNIPLSLIDESTTNPRRTFEPSKLTELAKSISINGLIQPITVRPKAERFEIVAGARRYRAAQIAELAVIPTRVLEINDAQTLEIQIIENSQREDVHPYEEASGYQRLLDLPGYDVAALASKCSKSQSHIYARLTLLSLIPEVAQAFQEEKITASHANLLARLAPEQQVAAYPNAFRPDYRDDDPHLQPAKYLATWIEENLYLALAEAPFDRESAKLVPEVGSCVACPKRTGYNTALFADVAEDNCLDGECFRSKINAHIESAKTGIANLVQISTVYRSPKEKPKAELSPAEYRVIQEEDGEPSETCDSAAPGIVTFGRGVGTIRMVCADHDCSIHYPRHSGPTVAGRVDSQWEAMTKRNGEEREQRKRDKEKREKRLRSLILRFPSSGTEAQNRFLLTALVMGDLDDASERIALRLEGENTDSNKSSEDVCAEAIATCMPSSLLGYFAELALGSWVDVPRPEERDYLAEAEKLFPKIAAEPAAKKILAKKTAAKKATDTTRRR